MKNRNLRRCRRMSFRATKRSSAVALAAAGAAVLLPVIVARPVMALDRTATYVESFAGPGDFPVADAHHASAIYVDSADYAGVVRAVGDLQADVARVTGCTPTVTHQASALPANVVIVGAIGKSAVVDRLIRENKIDVRSIVGKWESFLIQVVPHPLPGVASALVIVGSDKRGAIFGVYDLSAQMGVSPWYWWADVPTPHRDALYVKPVRYVEGEPAVKYRGIFINDEEPALGGWSREKFGGVNSKMYTHMFELLLRLKANYLWPAMWGKSLYEDDPESPRLANEYGIVIGTSHHEPMMRAQADWAKHGTGPWDYVKNGDTLRAFWTEGVRRTKDYETIITVGMRGDGDKPMMDDEDAATKLMETIVADQRKIIAAEVNPDPSKVPQDWALYKEVQDYYEKGMRVPDDVTLLWADDNWGNLRRLPTADERPRSGGAGIYYHVDYVGGPRSYKWLNTVPITKIWEQMNLAHQYDANRIWILNVGDLKPMELPIEFFLDFARAPEQWPNNSLSRYTQLWAERQFGPKYAPQIADILEKYTKYNGRRKPELLSPNTYSLVDYREADTVAAQWQAIADEADRIYAELPPQDRDAFFQLVLYPTKACAVVNELYVAVGKNRLYAAQGRANANDYAVQAQRLFQEDADLASTYNHDIASGKWDHMMDQSHIGYFSWNDPPKNIMPAVQTVDVPAVAEIGVAVEGASVAWPMTDLSAAVASDPALPAFDVYNRQRRFIDVFDSGQTPARFTLSASAPWIHASVPFGTPLPAQRVWVSVDWGRAPVGTSHGSITISPVAVTGSTQPATVSIEAVQPASPTPASLKGFVEANGYVSIEAEHFTGREDIGAVGWRKIDDYGRTLSSMTVFPVTAPSVTPPNDAPCLEYRMYLFDTGTANVDAILAPTQDFVPGRSLRYAISFDDEAPQIVEIPRQTDQRAWSKAVSDSVYTVTSTHQIAAPGYHTLKFWMVDPGVVLQKLVVNLGGVKPSYLGPPESYHAGSIGKVASVGK
jgi:hypothetical protein